MKTELENNTFNKNDVFSYWLSLFPELDKVEELNEVVKKVSRTSVTYLYKGLADKSKAERIDIILSNEPNPPFDRIIDEALGGDNYTKLYIPFIRFYFYDFYPKIMEIDIVLDKIKLVREIISQVVSGMNDVALRTIILEINIFRMKGILKGETPQERFNYYFEYITKDTNLVKEFFEEYFELFELLCLKAGNSFGYIYEILNNTKNSYQRLSKLFGGVHGLGKIQKIDLNLGDTHNNGKSVAIIHFENNKLVYKPRNTGLEESFQKLLAWINESPDEGIKKIRTVKVYSCKKYGWMEFVEYEECRDVTQVQNYYRKIGQLICLLYLLNAKDLHHENIISCQDNPILIDLEALFHPYFNINDRNEYNAFKKANRIIDDSVLSVGILPQRILNNKGQDEESIDLSGLGAEEEQYSPIKGIKIENKNKDDIKICREYGVIKPKQNIPKLFGESQIVDDYKEDVMNGFAKLYLMILSNSDKFIRLILNLFSDKSLRLILRPTYLYGQLLIASFHPDFLRERIHRKIFLSRLGLYANKDNFKILYRELKDLLGGDIPCFNANSSSRHIYSKGHVLIRDFIEAPPLNASINKIRDMSMQDLEKQKNFITMSFKARETDALKDITGIKYDIYNNICSFNSDRWLRLSREIGDYILDSSIISRNAGVVDRTWISTVLLGKKEITWSVEPVGNDFYNGNSGIALYLAYLGYVTKQKKYLDAAFEAIQLPIMELDGLNISHPYTIGAFSGLGSYFYVLDHLSRITASDELKKYMYSKIGILGSLAYKDTLFDVVSGSAGCMAVLTSIIENTEDEEEKKLLIDIAYRNYNHLVRSSKAYQAPDALSWSYGKVYEPSSGFSHGNAGIAAFMAKFSNLIKDTSITSVIQNTLKLERMLYSQEHENWHATVLKSKISHGWCHGAPGILLSKLMLLQYGYIDTLLEEEIEIALRTTMTKSFGYNPSLCHGDLGNLLILMHGAKVLHRHELSNQCYRVFQGLYENVISKRWRNGVFRGTTSLGLMVGLAGFGYSLLKFCEPDMVPNVLILE